MDKPRLFGRLTRLTVIPHIGSAPLRTGLPVKRMETQKGAAGSAAAWI